MKKFITLLSAFALLTSCHFLDEKPTTSLGDEDAYGSTGALEAQIYGILTKFQGDAMITGCMHEYLQDCSGLIHWGDAPTGHAPSRLLSTPIIRIITKSIAAFSRWWTEPRACWSICLLLRWTKASRPRSQARQVFTAALPITSWFAAGVTCRSARQPPRIMRKPMRPVILSGTCMPRSFRT